MVTLALNCNKGSYWSSLRAPHAMCNLPLSPSWIVDPAGAKKFTVFKSASYVVCELLSRGTVLIYGTLCAHVSTVIN